MDYHSAYNFNFYLSQDENLKLEFKASFRTPYPNYPKSVIKKGKEIGKTPYKASLKGGVHSIVLEKDGYVTVKEFITISNTKDRIDRAYRMKHLPSTLTFSVEPEGGQLLLNGREVSPLGSYEVDSKTKHTLTYTLEGFFPLTRNVILEEGEEKSY